MWRPIGSRIDIALFWFDTGCLPRAVWTPMRSETMGAFPQPRRGHQPAFFIVLIVFPERLAALPSGGPSHSNRHRCTNTVNSNAMFSYFAIVYFCIMQGLAIFRTIDRLFRILTLIWYVRWLKAVRCGFVSYPLERKHKQCTLSFNIIFQTCFL